METVLVTGGAGFIGSHTCKTLAAQGFLPVAFDDLSRGHADFVRWGPRQPHAHANQANKLGPFDAGLLFSRHLESDPNDSGTFRL